MKAERVSSPSDIAITMSDRQARVLKAFTGRLCATAVEPFLPGMEEPFTAREVSGATDELYDALKALL